MAIQLEELKALIRPNSDGHYPSLQELGEHFHVTRERIRQLLVQHGIQKPRNFATCMRCGVNHRIPGRNYCITCRPEIRVARTVTFTCGQCGEERVIRRAQYKDRLRRGKSRWLFCSHSCSSLYYTAKGKVGWSKLYPGEGSLYVRKRRALGITVTRRMAKPTRPPKLPRQKLRHTTNLIVGCTLCQRSILITYRVFALTLGRHGTTNHYCRGCAPFRPHARKNSQKTHPCQDCGCPTHGKRCQPCHVANVLNRRLPIP